MKQVHWRIALGALASFGLIWWVAFGFEERMFSTAYKSATWVSGYVALNGLFAYAVAGPVPGSRK